MQIITNRNQLNDKPPSPLRDHLLNRYNGLVETEDDLPPIFIIAEHHDDITGPDYAFIGPQGLLSDLFDEHQPGHPEFARPYEWASYLPELHLYEALLLINGEDGYLILIQEVVVQAHPDLYWILTDDSQGGLSDPQPL
jgi:hypothetical protein